MSLKTEAALTLVAACLLGATLGCDHAKTPDKAATPATTDAQAPANTTDSK